MTKQLTPNEPCPSCGRYGNRATTVDGLVIRDGTILLIKRGREPFRGHWGTPGGYLDHNETIDEAVDREVKEETGLTVTAKRFVGVFSNPDRHPQQAIAYAFALSAEGEPEARDDADDCQWFPLDQLPENMAFDHADIIATYLAQEAEKEA